MQKLLGHQAARLWDTDGDQDAGVTDVEGRKVWGVYEEVSRREERDHWKEDRAREPTALKKAGVVGRGLWQWETVQVTESNNKEGKEDITRWSESDRNRDLIGGHREAKI